MLLAPMVARLRAQPNLRSVLRTALADVVSLHGAEFGNLQLRDSDGALLLVAHIRLPAPFLASFRRVEAAESTVCARAARAGRTLVVSDVETDREFAPFLAQAQQTRFRSVLSSPLATRRGMLVGVVSAHFANPYRPTPVEIATLEGYTPVVAECIVEKVGGVDVAAVAAELYDEILGRGADPGGARGALSS